MILSKNVLSNLNTFSIECNKGLFLDVNIITRFFDGHTRQSPQK